MKVTQSQLIELVQIAAGVQNVEVVEDESQSDYNQDTALQAIDSNREGIIRPRIEGTLRETIEKEVGGIHGGKLETWLTKNTGISRAAMKDKSDEEKVALAVKHLTSQLDGDKQATQAKIDEILAEHNQQLESIKGDYESKLTAANQKYISREIRDYMKAELKDFPFKSDVDRDVAVEDLHNALMSKYDLNFDEANKAVKLFTKDKPGIEALNAAQTNKITIKDEATAYFTPRGQIAKDMREERAVDHLNRQGQNTYVPTGQQTQVDQANPVGQFNQAFSQFAESQGIAVSK